MFKQVTFGGYDTEEVDAQLSQLLDAATDHGNERAELQARIEAFEQERIEATERSLLLRRVRDTFASRSEEVLQLAVASLPKAQRTIVIGLLDPATAAAFLAALAPQPREAMLTELSRVRMVSESEALDILRRFLDFFGAAEQTHFEVGGRAWLRTVVHEAGRSGALLCQVVEDTGQPGLAQELRTQLLTLDHLARWPRLDLMNLLKHVDSATLAVAMVGGSASFQTAALACVSRRAAENLREEVEILGDRPASYGDDARRTILATAAELIADGSVTGIG